MKSIICLHVTCVHFQYKSHLIWLIFLSLSTKCTVPTWMSELINFISQCITLEDITKENQSWTFFFFSQINMICHNTPRSKTVVVFIFLDIWLLGNSLDLVKNIVHVRRYIWSCCFWFVVTFYHKYEMPSYWVVSVAIEKFTFEQRGDLYFVFFSLTQVNLFRLLHIQWF